MKYNFQCTKGVLSPCFIIVSSQASQCCVASVIVPSDFVASSLNQVLMCYLEKLSHACFFSHLLGERVGPSPSCKQFHVVKLLLLRWLFIADVIFFFLILGCQGIMLQMEVNLPATFFFLFIHLRITF